VVIGILLATAAILQILLVAKGVIIWVLIAAFLALALNPAVEWLQAHGVSRRGAAVGVTFLGAIGVIVAVGALFVPTLVNEVNNFANAVPDYVEDLTKGRGRLGFLERDYHIVERIRDAVEKQGASGVLGLSGTALSVTKSVVTGVVAILTIAFLTLFMLLEGPGWVERFYGLFAEERQPRLRNLGQEIYRVVGGYVAGNLLISLIAGVASTLVLLLLDIQYAVALGLLVAILDLVPLAGRDDRGGDRVDGGDHRPRLPHRRDRDRLLRPLPAGREPPLQPLVYGKTVQLSPLAVLISVLIGAEVAGVIGALGAIPVAGTIQVILRDWLAHRKREMVVAPPGVDTGIDPAS
jgi:predicted PurR-regulated permease PerM